VRCQNAIGAHKFSSEGEMTSKEGGTYNNNIIHTAEYFERGSSTVVCAI